MKHYEKLLELGCFSKNDLEQITGSEAAAKWLCREYQKKGYIERVKRDLYVAISLETQQPIANRYVIASHISNDAAVSYHSAFEFYGYSNQVFYETQVTSESRFRDFEYDGVTYRRIAPRITGGITEINGIRVTTLERTVIDSINLWMKQRFRPASRSMKAASSIKKRAISCPPLQPVSASLIVFSPCANRTSRKENPIYQARAKASSGTRTGSCMHRKI